MPAQIRLRGTLPARREARKEARGEMIAAGLEIVSRDPEFRLRMILGEAHQKWLDLAGWVAGEIKRSEEQTPGIGELAGKFARRPELLENDPGMRRQSPEACEAQQLLLAAAAALLAPRHLQALPNREK